MSRFGFNRAYIDELYAQYRNDPDSVNEAWRDFFEGYRPEDAPSAASREPAPAGAVPLVGPAAKIVENMERSLGIPTATSVRSIPVKLLEENRRIINRYQERTARPRISYTHLIGWSVLRALELHPALNAGFAERGGKPQRIVRDAVTLGLAIDVERRGERMLVVPNVKDAGALDFPTFVAAYDDLVARGRQGALQVPDFENTTVTLTNPGMLGTELSVPRLMAGQGTIVGVGAIKLPAEYTGMAPEVVAQLGLSRTMTVTSTYDHRVIQGAQSGAFLRELERLVLGEHGFYERVFRELGVPHEPLEWRADRRSEPEAEGDGGDAIAKQAAVLQLIRAYRVRGHLYADIDPLEYAPESHPDLELSRYGLSVWDMDRRFMAGGLAGSDGRLSLREIFDTLQETYCRHVGAEFMHIVDPTVRGWLMQRMERTRNAEPFDLEEQKQILRRLNAADAFETFLHTNYIGQKRFSLEGAESLIPMLEFLLRDAAEAGIERVVFGMAHRGRLNVLANVVGKEVAQIFREFEGDADPQAAHGSGDVKYHLGAEGEYVDERTGRRIHLGLSANPSHLEAVDPVVEGIVRANQDRDGDRQRGKSLAVLIHGDAAFAGQGVVAETLNLSQLPGYRTGGTVHIVVNNQIGFTTGPREARSSHYPTDVAKMVYAPILHANGDHPEDAVRVARTALAFRQRFQRDIVVDLVCYRRWGHNEADDPSYTHPILYAKIESHRSVRKLYTEQLLRRGDIDPEIAEAALSDFRERLAAVHEEVRRGDAEEIEVASDDDVELEEPVVELGDELPPEMLGEIIAGLERLPDGFELHPKLARQFEARRKRFEDDQIDWALAEALSFGSLVLSGVAVRLSGEDSGRGTFSQRHAVLHDQRTGDPITPLARLDDRQAPFWVFDSLLSEFAVLGFEYGFSVEWPQALVLWEAQFGDFVNGAQVIIDQFLTSAEAKWGQRSNLVLLLPHGYEGQGPEHSSARYERFLQLAARENIRVAVPSTPAQYFHMLREQAAHSERKPLIAMTPKSLLRRPDCVSSREELRRGGFQRVLDDPDVDAPDRIRRVVLCTGKLYFDLAEGRRERGGTDDLALVRVERLYPFPERSLGELLARYPAADDVVWAQEEPRNMGAWPSVVERLPPCLREGQRLRYVGRSRRASPATGSQRRHVAEQQRLLEDVLDSREA